MNSNRSSLPHKEDFRIFRHYLTIIFHETEEQFLFLSIKIVVNEL